MTRTTWTGLLATGVLLSSVASLSHGLKVPFESRAPRGASFTSPRSPSRYSLSSSDKEVIDNMQDVRYTTNITINGVVTTVVLDTGSTDLWVNPPGGVGEFNDTGLPLELLYGDGSYGVSGTIGVSPFTYGTYHVDQQAFLNVNRSTINSLENLGIYGIFGLSFDIGAASPINQKIQETFGPDATWGRSILRNIFAQNPDTHDFVALDLGRSDDLEETDGGSLFIGEWDPRFAAGIADSPELPQYPPGGRRWTVLMEGLTVDGVDVPLQSTIDGVPAGNVQALLDTGDPTAIFPVSVVEDIYSRVPGAKQFQASEGTIWLLPCNTTSIVELQFHGVKYPIHPLDLTSISDPITLNGNEYTACVGAFHGVDNWAPGEFDISLGDSFLRNVYASFDFGYNPTTGLQGTPYIQLLSQIDIPKAQAQVETIRAKTLEGKPPTLDPEQIVELLGNSDSNTEGGNKLGSSSGGYKDNKDNTSASVLLGEGGVTLTVSSNELRKWGLIAIALLGLNVLIGLVLIGLAVCACMKKGKSLRRSSTMAPSVPHYVPVPLNSENTKEAPHYDDGSYQGFQDNTYKGYDPNARYSTQ